jgi:DnaD/phage-associated family protein
MSTIEKLCESEEFLTASKDELRALVVLLSKGRISADDLANYARITKARAKGALILWEEVGVFELEKESIIEDIYPERESTFGVMEEPRQRVAKTIQSEELATLLEECAKLLGKPTLNDPEVKIITGLYSQYGLTEEYLFTLFSDITYRSAKPTAKKLEVEAIRLFEKGIDTTEGLSEYFHHRDSVRESERVVRRALSLGRALSPSEKRLAESWVSDYGYGEEMITFAYDVATSSTTSPTLKYIAPILNRWHENGLKTVEDARAFQEANKGEGKPTKKSKKEAPRYGNFDPDEAFKRALERSYSEESEVM